MFDVRDLFQWERFITPSIIRVFYWVAVLIATAGGLAGIASALQLMQFSPIGGLIMAIISILGAFAVILAARIGAEFVLIMFRINEHLGALRNRAEM
jgi:hypothetical protein